MGFSGELPASPFDKIQLILVNVYPTTNEVNCHKLHPFSEHAVF
jgi:hypothetical protein